MTEDGVDSRAHAKIFAIKNEICLFPKNLV